MTAQLRDATVAIVGVGLIGGSLAAALAGRCAHRIGVAKAAAGCAEIEAANVVDSCTEDLGAAVAAADVVVLATSVDKILELLPQVGRLARHDTVVLDVGSSKEHVVAAMDALPTHIAAVGGHPMCGGEQGGVAHARAELLNGAAFATVATQRTTGEADQLVGELVRAVGARRVEIASAQEHDRIVAATSHLPYAASTALAAAIAKLEHAQTARAAAPWAALRAGGYRDTTRMAASSSDMWAAILRTNARQVRIAIACLQQQLDELDAALGDDSDALDRWLASARAARIEALA